MSIRLGCGLVALLKAVKLNEILRYLIVVDKVFQLISVDDDMQSAHLRQTEFSRVHAREANLLPSARGVCFAGAVHSTWK